MRAIKHWKHLTPTQKIARWTTAVQAIQKLTPHQQKKHFDMSVWADKTNCGTIGCAAGFCALDPAVRRQGFKLDFVKAANVEGTYLKFTGPDPLDFYGNYAYHQIFTNSEFTDGQIVGIKIYRLVRDAMKKYLKQLKAGTQE